MGFIPHYYACEVMFEGKLNLYAVKKGNIEVVFHSSLFPLSPSFFHIAPTQNKMKKGNNDFLKKKIVFFW